MRLSLLGTFELADSGSEVSVRQGLRRILAFLAIADRTVARSVIAGTLWPDASTSRAQASLRSALSQLDGSGRKALQVSAHDLALSADVSVDLRDARALAHRLLNSDRELADSDVSQSATALLSRDLLPDWYDDWIVAPAEQLRDLRIHALEAIARRLAAGRRFGDAAEAARAAIAADPLRESSQAALIRVHLAEGNRSEALAVLQAYRALLLTELQIEPSAHLETLLYDPAPRLDSVASVVLQARTAVAGEEVHAFEVAATGISMEPTIRHGDKLLVSRDVDPSAGRIVVAVHNGTWIVKRIAIRDGALVLRSDNADEEVRIIDVELHGVVVEIRRTV